MRLRHALILLSCVVVPALDAQRPQQVDSATAAAVRAERQRAPADDGRISVAVLHFSVETSDTALAPLGYGVAELLADDLARSHTLRVLERLRIGEIERERELQASPAADSTLRNDARAILGAQHIVIGSIVAPSETGASTMQARSVRVESGAVELRRTASGDLADVFRIEHDLAMATFAAFGVALTPSEQRALDERVAPSLDGFLAFSRGVRAESRGDHVEAARNYERAAKLDGSFKLARVKLAAAMARLSATSATPAAHRALHPRRSAPRRH